MFQWDENSEEKLLVILKDVSGVIPDCDIKNIRNLFINWEWWIGMEVLCTQLDEYEVAISAALFSKIEVMAREMDMPPTTWEDIQHLVENLKSAENVGRSDINFQGNGPR